LADRQGDPPIVTSAVNDSTAAVAALDATADLLRILAARDLSVSGGQPHHAFDDE
jgi:hypothetical protein